MRPAPETATTAAGEPLPFKGKVEAPPPAAAQLQEESEDEDDVDFGRTVPTDGLTSPFRKDGVLPFALEDDTAARPTSTSAPASEQAAVSSAPEAGVAVALEIPSGVPNLTVEQYASLHASCSEQPDRVEVTHQEYGLPDAKAREELDAHWGRRFDANPDLREQFDKLVEQYRHWYRQQQRG